jgi:FtsP/CotA-like multicopper oxidase with cupredoxin domain
MSELNQEEQQQEEVRENSEQDTLKLGVSRRTFIGTGMTAAAAALVLPRQAIADDLCDDPNNNPDLDPTPGQNFMQPIVVEPNSPINLSATCVPAANGDITRRFCYNDQKMLPGPTFRVSPGSELNIEYKNELPDNFPEFLAPGPYPKKVNITNLHFHGLHVSPLSLDSNGIAVSGNADNTIESSSDDVLIEINPGCENVYKVHIPTDHAPGTHWYHPHLHGSTAVQVVNGMAGAIIIDEKDDERLACKDKDFVFVIQDVVRGSRINEGGRRSKLNDQRIMVNGQIEPILRITSNTMYRLRFINATALPTGFIKLKFIDNRDGSQICSQKIEDDTDTAQCRGVYRVAVDGISHYGMPPVPVDHENGWDMSPGNRADFLVMLHEGDYTVTIEPNEYAKSGGFECDDVGLCGILAKICVEQGPDAPEYIFPNRIPLHSNICDTEVPDTDCLEVPQTHYLGPLLPGNDTDNQTVQFSKNNSNEGTINGETYDSDTLEFNVVLDAQETWLITHGGGGQSAHPFHIHVNPFQVIEIGDNDDNPYEGIWWDTFYIARNKPVTIRHRFKDYVGKSVFHCHILTHEDRGMMRNINVNGIGKGPGPDDINWIQLGTKKKASSV